MAECYRYICSDCRRSIDAWSDGNPYYIDEAGQKQYAYHPNHELRDKCIGNDSPHLCLDCGKEVLIDSRVSGRHCPDCESKKIIDTFLLEGVACPTCKTGRFQKDPKYFAIS